MITNVKYPRNSVPYLITEGLGYCCESFFFDAFAPIQSVVIATRLGVSPRTIGEHRAKWREGKLKCTECANCLKGKLK
tara:strand:- start:123 stop:356 length:234 start_codon:yes stop_codon:yes gene_type:complete